MTRKMETGREKKEVVQLQEDRWRAERNAGKESEIMSWKVKRIERERVEKDRVCGWLRLGEGEHGEEVNLECKDRRVQEERRGGRKAEEDGEVIPRLEGGVTGW